MEYIKTDYIKQLNAFELWLETNYLSGVSQLIWYKLFMLFNRCGWVEWVTVENLRLMVLSDIKSETTFITNRDKLIENGLIEYQKGKKGSPNRYKMIQLYTIENTPKNEVYNANNNCTPKNGVNTELKRSENNSQNGVNPTDINKLNETKLNKNKITTESAYEENSPAHKETDKPKNLSKQLYGEFKNIKMTDGEYKKLIERFDKSLVDSKIDSLDMKIQNKIKLYCQYKDHYSAIMNWCKSDMANNGGYLNTYENRRNPNANERNAVDEGRDRTSDNALTKEQPTIGTII